MGYKRRRRFGNPDANQQDVIAFARKRLGAIRSVVTTVVGGGFPDNVVPFRGLTILVEVKGPKGKLEKSQEDFIRNWDGGPILVVDGPEDLYRQLIALDKLTPPVRGLAEDFRKAVEDAVAATAGPGTGEPDAVPLADQDGGQTGLPT